MLFEAFIFVIFVIAAGYTLSLLMIVKTLPLLVLLLIYIPPVMWRKNSLIISDNDSEFIKLEIKDDKKFIDLINKYGGVYK